MPDGNNVDEDLAMLTRRIGWRPYYPAVAFERQLLELTGICVGVLASRGRKDEMAFKIVRSIPVPTTCWSAYALSSVLLEWWLPVPASS